MGYTGSVSINGQKVLQEWKSSNTNYGKDYATAYLRQLGCEVGMKQLLTVIGNIYSSRFDKVGEADRQITYSTKLISILREMVSNQYEWDENDVFDGETFLGKYDRVGLARYSKNKNNPTGLEEDRPCFLETSFFFKTAFGDEVIGNQYYDNFVNNKKFSKLYFIEMIELLYKKQEESMKIYAPARKNDEEIIEILKSLAKDIENGDSLRIRFSPTQENLLQVFSMKTQTIRDISVVSEYPFFDLFDKNNLYCLGAFCEITTKKDLGIMISTFDKVKNRNYSIENSLKDFYNKITDTDVIKVVVEGSY